MSISAYTGSISTGYYSLSGSSVKTDRIDPSTEMLNMASGSVSSNQIKDSTAADLIMRSDALRDELQNDPELKRIREEVAILAKKDNEFTNLEMMSKLPASRRPPEYEQNGIVYNITKKLKDNSYWDVKKIQIGLMAAIAVAVAEFAFTMSCGPIGRSALMPYALGTQLVSGLAVCHYFPGLYDKYVIPGKASRLATDEIKQEHEDVKNDRKKAETVLKDRENEIVGGYVKKMESLIPGLDADKAEQSIDDGSDYVDIGGVKISKRIMNISNGWNITQ
ncbi:MAG: hypothetical protein AB9903_03785 [Vulcanimicrobiota bacterium]